jgi:hypothetical protein
VQPDGFASLEEMLESRKCSIQAFRDVITSSDRFVFTMGSTEGWVNWFEGYDYATCPGTIAGTFDPAKHEFKNYGFEEILSDMQLAIDEMHKANRNLRFLITVSPAPLTATASGEHVLTATTYSQSVLRAVAGAIAAKQPTVDYFPSYEIIASPPFRGMFYEPDQRTIAQAGLDLIMDSFIACLRTKFEARPHAAPAMRQKRQAAQKKAETEVGESPPVAGLDVVAAAVEPADQVDHEQAAGLSERQGGKFVEAGEVPTRDVVGHALESDAPLGLEPTNPVDETEERAVPASTGAGPGDNDGRGHFVTLDG